MDLDPDALLNGRLGRLMLTALAGFSIRMYGTGFPLAPAPGEVIAEGVKRATQNPAPWFTDQAALLRPVAEAAETWAFGSHGPELDQLLSAEAESLRPLAELVAQAPAASWWLGPPAREHQRWLGCQHHPVLARGGEVAEAVRTAGYIGAWWSGPLGDTVWTTRGDLDLGGLPALGLACAEDAFGEEDFDVWALSADPAARVYEVHGPGDWARLAGTYPRQVTGSQEWERWTGRPGPRAEGGRGDGSPRWIKPDWPLVAQDWDGVHVSVSGYLTTAGQAVGDTLLAGWDADQTLWLRDVFTDVRPFTAWHGTPGSQAISE
jgi:hypothetical protein